MKNERIKKQRGSMSNQCFIALALVFFLISCSSEDKGRLIAKVGDKELYSDDIKLLNYSASDSEIVVSRFVSDWAEEQILLAAAEENQNIDLLSIERKVERFRNELLIYQLENYEIEAKLDTTVSDQEIENYYKAHKDDFQLNDYLVKVLYLKVPFDTPELESAFQRTSILV
jgi:hypothetical protein